MRPLLLACGSRLLASTCGSPAFLAAMVAFAVGIGAVHDALRCVQRSNHVARCSEVLAMRRAAASAIAGVAEPGVPGCRAAILHDGDETIVEVVGVEGRRRVFAGQRLPGASAAAFGEALTDGAAATFAPGGAALPVPDRRALAVALRGDVIGNFRREPDLALRHLAAGTDADDYVFAASANQLGAGGAAGLVVVPGNLWLEPGGAPLELELGADVVIAVLGNIYCGRSLRLTGPGRLLLAAIAPPGATVFDDVDGNGRWSSGDRSFEGSPFVGPIEGAGAVHFVRAAGTAPIVCDAGVFAAGRVCVEAPSVVAGPVVATRGIAWRGGATLAATGQRRYRPAKELVAGFVTDGVARVGSLRELTDGPDKQPLYLAVPAR
jgi:hypothetical protein